MSFNMRMCIISIYGDIEPLNIYYCANSEIIAIITKQIHLR